MYRLGCYSGIGQYNRDSSTDRLPFNRLAWTSASLSSEIRLRPTNQQMACRLILSAHELHVATQFWHLRTLKGGPSILPQGSGILLVRGIQVAGFLQVQAHKLGRFTDRSKTSTDSYPCARVLCFPLFKHLLRVGWEAHSQVHRSPSTALVFQPAVKHTFQQESETKLKREETKGSPQEKTEGSENLSALVSPSSSTTGQSRTRSLNQKRDMPEARTCRIPPIS